MAAFGIDTLVVSMHTHLKAGKTFGQKNFKKPLNDMKSLAESWKGKDGKLWLYGSVKLPTHKKYTENLLIS